jgi:hypothetical protein
MGLYYVSSDSRKEYERLLLDALEKIGIKNCICSIRQTLDNGIASLSFEIGYKQSRREPKVDIISFNLTEMPHCCGLIVSHGVYVGYSFENKGIGKAIHECRLQIMRDLGYSCAICTDENGNTPQEKILKRFKWKTVHTFLNDNSDNEVNISVLDLTKEAVVKKKVVTRKKRTTKSVGTVTAVADNTTRSATRRTRAVVVSVPRVRRTTHK